MTRALRHRIIRILFDSALRVNLPLKR